MDKKKLELRREVLLSLQRALLGMIYPSIRAIAVGYDDIEKLKVIYYLDREPNEDDYDNINDVVGEVCSDINFQEAEELCVFTKEYINKLDKLVSWVYVRKEEL